METHWQWSRWDGDIVYSGADKLEDTFTVDLMSGNTFYSGADELETHFGSHEFETHLQWISLRHIYSGSEEGKKHLQWIWRDGETFTVDLTRHIYIWWGWRMILTSIWRLLSASLWVSCQDEAMVTLSLTAWFTIFFKALRDNGFCWLDPSVATVKQCKIFPKYITNHNKVGRDHI